MTDHFSPGGMDRGRLSPEGGTGTGEQTSATPAAELSPALARFRSCRWRRPPEDNGGVECCGHRDVLPLAGSTSFDPEAWCPDCGFYKLRRTPKKRQDYSY